MLQAGEVFAGYVVKRVLGQGGMGTVYLAQHPRLPRLTALKLLDRELYADDEIRGRFEREADLVARLDHPNIVTVYDRGAEGDQLWISMQFVAGSDAAGADVNTMIPARAVHIIADTAAALDFAHANGVLHRDVKPANILLAKAPIGQPERVLLTDFGIAAPRNADTTLSSAGQITATLAYAAPEQLSGTSLDHRADQYSLACTLYWMLTGTPPFSGTPAVILNGHLFGPVPSLRDARPGLPPVLDAVLARALAKRPEDRFASCAEFAAAARRALTSAAPQQPPPPVGPAGYPPQGTRSYTGYVPHPTQATPQPGAYPPRRHGPRPGYRPPAYPNQPAPQGYPPATGYTSGIPRTAGIPPGAVPPRGGAPGGPGQRPASGPNSLPPRGTDAARPGDSPHPVEPARPVGPARPVDLARHGDPARPPGRERQSDSPRPVDQARPAGAQPPGSAAPGAAPGSAAPQRPPSGTRRTARPITIALPDAPIRRPRPPIGESDR
ncbi:protein kinase [Nocardia sp. NPDC127579]|uniref:protein kinase domain-containing protein n=1 Tax=Nocardia sp. NPDC127579 TaxID=3345402 RepID=UPI003639D803